MKGEIEIKVRGYHLDVYSHVNNARYVEFLEEGRWALFENLELTKAALEMGYALNIVNINISYTNEACLGEILVLKTELKKYGNKSITLSQKILRKSDGKQAVDADVTFVMLDMKTGRAVELNDSLKQLLDKKL
jgi:thioesterase-3